MKLKDLCIKVVAENFESSASEISTLSTRSKIEKKIVDILPIDLPLELAGGVSRRASKPAMQL